MNKLILTAALGMIFAGSASWAEESEDELPTAVNSQISDTVTQENTQVLGDSPAVALGNEFISTSQALSNAAHNATAGQQQTNITEQAATTEGVTTLYSVDQATETTQVDDPLEDLDPQP